MAKDHVKILLHRHSHELLKRIAEKEERKIGAQLRRLIYDAAKASEIDLSSEFDPAIAAEAKKQQPAGTGEWVTLFQGKAKYPCGWEDPEGNTWTKTDGPEGWPVLRRQTSDGDWIFREFPKHIRPGTIGGWPDDYLPAEPLTPIGDGQYKGRFSGQIWNMVEDKDGNQFLRATINGVAEERHIPDGRLWVSVVECLRKTGNKVQFPERGSKTRSAAGSTSSAG